LDTQLPVAERGLRCRWPTFCAVNRGFLEGGEIKPRPVVRRAGLRVTTDINGSLLRSSAAKQFAARALVPERKRKSQIFVIRYLEEAILDTLDTYIRYIRYIRYIY